MVEVGGVDVGGSGQAQVDAVAGLIVDDFGDEMHAVEEDAGVDHHFIGAVLVPDDLDQVVVLELNHEVIEGQPVRQHLLLLAVLRA
jgi:NRPS condensation-like uncharacterized protein